ncbi:MAG TPA: hypothetical protein VNA25_04000, partial [Phycisphaerae bacterium]|nr:hypothetical protein [Phycisphaerae bacterium]
ARRTTLGQRQLEPLRGRGLAMRVRRFDGHVAVVPGRWFGEAIIGPSAGDSRVFPAPGRSA